MLRHRGIDGIAVFHVERCGDAWVEIEHDITARRCHPCLRLRGIGFGQYGDVCAPRSHGHRGWILQSLVS
ncbi:MAG: hypothetical protein WBM28_08990 [Burkholderiales bacterium]